MDFLVFQPIYKERVWGGRRLESLFGRALPVDLRIGESWDIVDRETDQSRTPDGLSLREHMESDATSIMGKDWPKGRPFPLLIKWLDCSERLSLQVHPPANVAGVLGGEPKSEAWYLAGAEPGSVIIAGLKRGVSQKAFEQAIASNELECLVHQLPVNEGDSIFIPSGRIHAIGAGSLILEVQENSDTTYRVYDWGRQRELHVEQSLKSIDFEDFEPKLNDLGNTVLAKCDSFRLVKKELIESERITFNANEEPRIISIISGSVRIYSNGSKLPQLLFPGSNILLPYSGSFDLEAAINSNMLVVDQFSSI